MLKENYSFSVEGKCSTKKIQTLTNSIVRAMKQTFSDIEITVQTKNRKIILKVEHRKEKTCIFYTNKDPIVVSLARQNLTSRHVKENSYIITP